MKHFIAEQGGLNSGPDILNPIFSLYRNVSSSSSQGHNGVCSASASFRDSFLEKHLYNEHKHKVVQQRCKIEALL